MKTLKAVLLVASALMTVPAVASPKGEAPAKAAAKADHPLLAKMKSLAGTWRSQMGEMTSTVTYRVTGGGQCVAETMQLGADKDMLTMYCADGDAMVATHYCDSGNQPRMRAERLSPDGKSVDFRFKDITNLPSQDAHHMRAVKFIWTSDRSVSQQWETGGKGEKADKGPTTFTLTRVK